MHAATIVFTAHNRRDMVLEAIRLAKLQTVPVEIIVMDDCSTDGTGDALAELHPDVRHVRSDVSVGPCYQRNRGFALAGSEIVFGLDDDSMLVSPRTIEQTLADFVAEDAGLIAIPFQNILQSEDVIHARDDRAVRQAAADFVACAHAVRREPFLAVGGYNENYFYMNEESDLALRLLQHGYHVELGSADPIHHMQPPKRRSYKADFYGRRNDVLFYYLLAPPMRMPARVVGTTVKGLMFGARTGCLKAAVDGLVAGFRLTLSGKVRRTPVSTRTFDLFMRLRSGGRASIEEVRAVTAH